MCDWALWDKALSEADVIEIYGSVAGQTGQGKGRRLNPVATSCGNNLALFFPMANINDGWNTFGLPSTPTYSGIGDAMTLYAHAGYGYRASTGSSPFESGAPIDVL